MGRLQQLNPNNYASSTQISPEFESIIRYLNAGERGNRTLGELHQRIFDENGNVRLGVDFRFSADGLEMRVGDTDTWVVLATADELRGLPGRDVGEVALPIIAARVDVKATAAQTVFPYAHVPSDNLFVFSNGRLLTPFLEYTDDPATGTVTLSDPAVLNDVITIYKVRGSGSVATSRNDYTVTAASQVVFGVQLPTDAYQAQVYLNGILLAPNLDYVINDALQTVTLISDPAVVDDVLTTAFFSSASATTIPGFMLEGVYTDPATGLIPFERVSVPDGAIDADKVAGLQAQLDSGAKITIGSSTPVEPESGDLWMDTSSNPAVLKFYDGSQFLSTAPSSTLPSIRTTDANYIVAINSTGTAFVFKPLDFSSLIYKSEKGAAGGVATLDNDGRLDPSQRPVVRTVDALTVLREGAVVDGTYSVRRLFGEKVRITALCTKCVSGTGSVQLKIAGALVGAVQSVASVANDVPFGTVIEVDALVASKSVEVVVSSAASLNGLEMTIVIERLN